jgi:hypothetical protein
VRSKKGCSCAEGKSWPNSAVRNKHVYNL